MMRNSVTKFKDIILSFSILLFAACSTGYDNDGNTVYYNSWNEGSGQHKEKINANSRTFTILQFNRYAKDDHYVFYDGEAIDGADAKTFKSIGEFYAKDKYRGYYGNEPIKNSFGPTFKNIDSYYSSDGWIA